MRLRFLGESVFGIHFPRCLELRTVKVATAASDAMLCYAMLCYAASEVCIVRRQPKLEKLRDARKF